MGHFYFSCKYQIIFVNLLQLKNNYILKTKIMVLTSNLSNSGACEKQKSEMDLIIDINNEELSILLINIQNLESLINRIKYVSPNDCDDKCSDKELVKSDAISRLAANNNTIRTLNNRLHNNVNELNKTF